MIILASSSPRRRVLLGRIIPTFDIFSPDIDESQRHNETPIAYVRRMAAEKAFAGGIGRLMDGKINPPAGGYAVVLAADTIVISPDGQQILGKPATPEEAWQTLQLLRGQTHTVCTAVHIECFGRRMSGSIQTCDAAELVQTQVTMRHYTDAEIAAYVDSGDWRDKAGGYAIQHAGFHPVAHIEGCFTNVVGLPICAVKRALDALEIAPEGLSIPCHDECDCASEIPVG